MRAIDRKLAAVADELGVILHIPRRGGHWHARDADTGRLLAVVSSTPRSSGDAERNLRADVKRRRREIEAEQARAS